MKKLGKVIGWTAAVIALLLILGLAGLALFFPKEKAKEIAIEKISTALQRQVTIEGVSLSFWGGLGVSLEDIKIENPPGFDQPNLLTAQALDVKLSLIPLLFKRVEIDRVILDKPVIFMQRLPNGAVNFKFGAAVEEVSSEESQTPEETKVAALAISFEDININKGRLIYRDDSSRTVIDANGLALQSQLEIPEADFYKSRGQLKIDSLKYITAKSKLPAMNLSVDYDAAIDMKQNSVVLSDSRITVNGLEFDLKLGIPNLQTLAFVNAQIETEKAEFSKIISLLPETTRSRLAEYSLAGKLDLTAMARYNKATIPTVNFEGKAEISGLVFSQKGIAGELTVKSLRAEVRNDYLKMQLSGGAYAGSPVEGYLTVNDFKNPVIDGHFKGKIDLALFNPFLPKEGEPEIAGQAEFDLGARGSAKDLTKLKMEGNLLVKDGKYSATTLPEPIESFNADIKLAPDNWVINRMAVEFPSSDIALTGNVKDPFPYILPKYSAMGRKPVMNFTMTSNRFDTDKLFPEAVPGSGVNRAALPADSLPPLLLPDINGLGKAQIDTLIYSKVEFTDITGDIDIKNRVIHVTDARGKVYTGNVTGATEIDLNDFSNPRYTGNFEATQVEANDFLTRFTNFGGHLFGKVNLNGDFSASGWEPEPLIQSLSMDGLAVFNEAKIVNLNLLTELSKQLNFKMPSEESLKDAATKFKVEDGRVVFEGLRFSSQLGDWNLIGSVGFDGSLDYVGEILLSEKVTGQLMSQPGAVSGFASLLKESGSGRVKVPFRLRGSYASPKLSLDFSVKEQMKDNLKNKFDSAIQNLLKKK